MFDYTVYPDNNPKLFKETCTLIEKEITGLSKENLLIDVDGSTIQVYYYNNLEIKVLDDYEVGAVYIISEYNLDDILRKEYF